MKHMMQNGQNQQYPIENRKRQNKINLLITAGISAGVAAIAAAILLMMALIGWSAPADVPEPDTPAVVDTASETGSMAISEVESKTEDVASSEITLSGAPKD